LSYVSRPLVPPGGRLILRFIVSSRSGGRLPPLASSLVAF